MQIEQGNKSTDRYTDGSKWGELWYRESMIPPSLEDKENGDPFLEDKENERPEEGKKKLARNLKPCVTETDKWWQEPSGNKWGEKR